MSNPAFTKLEALVVTLLGAVSVLDSKKLEQVLEELKMQFFLLHFLDAAEFILNLASYLSLQLLLSLSNLFNLQQQLLLLSVKLPLALQFQLHVLGLTLGYPSS